MMAETFMQQSLFTTNSELQTFFSIPVMVEVVGQAFDDAFGEVLLLGIGVEGSFFIWIGDEAQFQQGSRHVGVQEDVEVGRLDAAVGEVRGLHILKVDVVGQTVVIGGLAVVIGCDTTC